MSAVALQNVICTIVTMNVYKYQIRFNGKAVHVHVKLTMLPHYERSADLNWLIYYVFAYNLTDTRIPYVYNCISQIVGHFTLDQFF